jgi:probable HAF family extracellular repeat protein
MRDRWWASITTPLAATTAFCSTPAGQFYSIDYAGASTTSAYGINGDANIAGSFGFPYTSFVVYPIPPTWTGTSTSFSYPGAGATDGYSIDNDNNLLGSYLDTGNNSHGFLLTNNVVAATFQYPSATSTATLGVNDFGQIVGWYQDSSGKYHGFLAAPQ